jgi:hypothetical protein
MLTGSILVLQFWSALVAWTASRMVSVWCV